MEDLLRDYPVVIEISVVWGEMDANLPTLPTSALPVFPLLYRMFPTFSRFFAEVDRKYAPSPDTEGLAVFILSILNHRIYRFIHNAQKVGKEIALLKWRLEEPFHFTPPYRTAGISRPFTPLLGTADWNRHNQPFFSPGRHLSNF